MNGTRNPGMENTENKTTKRKNKKNRAEAKTTEIYRRGKEKRVQVQVEQPTGGEAQRTSKKRTPSPRLDQDVAS